MSLLETKYLNNISNFCSVTSVFITINCHWLGFRVTPTLTDSSTPQDSLVSLAVTSAAFLHPQHSNSWEDMLASGTVVQRGFHSGGSVQPQSPGDGRTGVALKTCPRCGQPDRQCTWHAALMQLLLVVDFPLMCPT